LSRKTTTRLAIDLGMGILMLMEMASVITDNTIHEFAGILLFVIFIIHNVLNRRWYRKVLKGRYNVLRILNITINLSLMAFMAVLAVSAVPISRTVFSFLGLGGDMAARQVHVMAAYWAFIFMSIHLGMHWKMITGMIRKEAGIIAANRAGMIALRILAVSIVVYGIYASFDRDIAAKLIMHSAFDFHDPNEPVIMFFIKYISIMGTYICGTYYIMKLIRIYNKARISAGRP